MGVVDKSTDFANEVRLHFPILLDRDFKIANSYIVSGLPTIDLIERDGSIAATIVGLRDWSQPQAQKLIEYLLSASWDFLERCDN